MGTARAVATGRLQMDPLNVYPLNLGQNKETERQGKSSYRSTVLDLL